MSIHNEPLVAQIEPQANLLVTEELVAAYEKASDPNLREIATVPLFEELCNVWLRCTNLSVYSQQAVDDTTHAVDLTVGFHDNTFELVFVLLLECKRHKVQSREELEAQLEEYGDRYLDRRRGGRGKNIAVYGATAYGTKIRFFGFRRNPGAVPAVMIPVVGPKSYAEEQYYWDVKTDGILIHRALLDVWALRKMVGPLRAGLSISSFGGAPILVRQNPSAAGVIPSAQIMSRDSLNPGAAYSPPTVDSKGKKAVYEQGASRYTEYKDVGGLLVYEAFYSFKVDGKMQMKYQTQWRQEGEYLYHDEAKLRGYLQAEKSTGQTPFIARSFPSTPTMSSGKEIVPADSKGKKATYEYEDIGKLSVYKEFYSFKVEGKIQMKYQTQWRQEGRYLYHDEAKLRGYL